MLTADLVLARRQKGELRLRALTSDDVARAIVIADALVREARARVGETRESLAAAWQDIVDETLDRRIVLGLQKLVLDACAFSQRAVVDAVAYRRELFTTAAAARRELPDGVTIDRESVVREVATRLGIAENALETGLFSDLRDADTLERAPSIDGATFVAEHPRAQAQAALLRATRAVCTVASRDAAAVRAFFRTLKFHKLLFEVEATGEGAFVVRVDGPFSLFESVTKYGLGFAMLLPALERLEAFEVVADVAWGKERTPLVLKLQGGVGSASVSPTDGHVDAAASAPRVSEDVERLFESLVPLCKAAGAKCALSAELVSLPGAGLVVPDFVVKRGKKKVFVELLGFWSRAAVWKRVELVEAGLGERVVFCASERLRVKEEVLEGDLASLYVWKGVPQARKVMDRVLRLLDRA